MKVSFTVPGQPVAKQRHRGAALQLCRKCGRKTARRICLCGSNELTYLTTLESTPKETVQYENRVAFSATETMKVAGLGMFTVPVELRVRFFFAIPPSRAKKLRDGDVHGQRPDLDNCIKSVEDGCNKIVWADDSLVSEIWATKSWGMEPRAEIEVETVPQD